MASTAKLTNLISKLKLCCANVFIGALNTMESLHIKSEMIYIYINIYVFIYILALIARDIYTGQSITVLIWPHMQGTIAIILRRLAVCNHT